ncbi:hypothetical protein, partial [Shewanella glacialipiscicola]
GSMRLNNDVQKKNSVVVLPEVLTGFSRLFKNARIFIWWLSVDNYFCDLPKGFRGWINTFLGRNTHINIQKMGRFEHLVQSEYAKNFLAQYGYQSSKLSDYLNREHFLNKFNIEKKQNIICYNPKKGSEVTQRLINQNLSLSFIPIQNMTAEQVAELLARSKIYIDFGHHPGKDRIPREAAMAGCIVITGVKGSAGNDVDIPVPRKYKHNEDNPSFFADVSRTIQVSLINYELAIHDFDDYRVLIELEQHKFNEEIDEFIKIINY